MGSVLIAITRSQGGLQWLKSCHSEHKLNVSQLQPRKVRRSPVVRKVEREGWCKERKSRREGMLDNGIKLGLRYIDTKLGIAILRGDHGYV